METSLLLSPTTFAAKLAVSLLIGILVGLERTRAHNEVGMMTFAIVSVLGAGAAPARPYSPRKLTEWLLRGPLRHRRRTEHRRGRADHSS
jgi:hypothetical protein